MITPAQWLTILCVLVCGLAAAIACDRRWHKLPLSILVGLLATAVAWFAATMFFYYFVPPTG